MLSENPPPAHKNHHPPWWTSQTYGRAKVCVWPNHPGDTPKITVHITVRNPINGDFSSVYEKIGCVRAAIAEFDLWREGKAPIGDKEGKE